MLGFLLDVDPILSLAHSDNLYISYIIMYLYSNGVSVIYRAILVLDVVQTDLTKTDTCLVPPMKI